MRTVLSLLIFYYPLHSLNSQDTLRQISVVTPTAYWVSGALMTAGLLAETGGRKEKVRGWIRGAFDVSTSNIDDIGQHVPIAMMYITDLALGVSKQEVLRQSRHLLVSQAATIGTSLLIKGISLGRRPNGGSRSFPSGHTAYAFASATTIFHSFKNKHMILALSGYVPAVVVGAYRMIKDKHWVSDVVFGAGMGMIFSHLSYHFNIWDSATIRTSNFENDDISLRFSGTSNGLGLVLTF